MTWQHMGASLLLVCGLGGCTVGPNYHPPQMPVPVTWSAGQSGGAEAHTVVAAQ